jgi:hypothetical protein
MSDTKKGLSAFLNKNKKTKKTTKTGDADSSAQTQVKEVVAGSQEKPEKNTPVANQDSSDEEVDELDIANKQLNYANIKETKDVAGNKAGEEKKLGFGFEEDKAAQQEDKPKEKKPVRFGDAPISFGGGRPQKFINKKTGGKLGEGFEEGLDDIDDDGKVKKREQKRFVQQHDGQKEFVHLGSSAKTAGDREEEKTEHRAPGVKPTFKGKLNLTKTGAQTEEKAEGVSKAYDFGVVYKSANPDGERRERKEGEAGKFGGQRKNRDKG